MSNTPEQLNIILVPHTHWDREWYQTFQQFRIRLVQTIDTLLDILDRDDGFRHFMLDGQTIVLDDYLEVAPEQEERLKNYTRTGRIQVGPWYLQPDEFLVSGESLIRNLQIGLQRAAEFGAPMRCGYVPDCFGHIAQLPQILRGFGIDNAFFWRGVGDEARQSEFYWAAPDGTCVLVVHLAAAVGYSNARTMPLEAGEFARRVELLAAELLPKATTSTLLFMNGSDHLAPQAGLPAAIAAADALLTSPGSGPAKLLGGAVEGIHVRIGTLPQYVEAIRQHNNGCLASTLAEAVGSRGGQAPSLQVLQGEMRSSQYAHLLPAVLSTRMWIKQQNTATEHLLENWVEPLTAWAWKMGARYPHGLVRQAWKLLLQNHPHDSICGCSIDQVHRENAVRFAQSQQVAEGVIERAMQSLAAAVDTRAPLEDASASAGRRPMPIVVFNPTSGPRNEVARAMVRYSGSLRDAAILDERGRRLPFAVIDRWRQVIGALPISRELAVNSLKLAHSDEPAALIEMLEGVIASNLGHTERVFGLVGLHIDTPHRPAGVAYVEALVAPSAARAAAVDHDLLAAARRLLDLLARADINMLEVSAIDQAQASIEFAADELPAYGLKTYWLYPRAHRDDARKAPGGALSAHERVIENRWYSVEASAQDGTLSVRDKLTGALFSGLNRLVDGGDVGDLYTYCPPAHDTLVSQPVEPPRIEVSAGPLRAVLRISGRWLLPVRCTVSRGERSARSTICRVTSEVSLTAGSRRVAIHTVVDNRARDHRLRVLFPVPYSVEHVAAEGIFEVRVRPVTAPRPLGVESWSEQPVNTFPHKRFVDISNGEIGLGLLNRGLPEYEVVSQGPGVVPGGMAIALTLLRCVEWLSRADLATRHGHAGPMEFTPEGQCQGRQEFDYALVLHSGDWTAQETLVLREAQAFNVPVRALALAAPGQAAALSAAAHLIEVEPRELMVSAIKRSDDARGLVVRLYNPLARAVEASLRPGLVFSRAFVANLQEECDEQLFWSGEQGETLHIGMRAGEITTIVLQ